MATSFHRIPGELGLNPMSKDAGFPMALRISDLVVSRQSSGLLIHLSWFESHRGHFSVTEDSVVGLTAPHPLVLHACWSAAYPRVGGVFFEDFATADDLQAALIAAGFPEESLSGTTVLQPSCPKFGSTHCQ